MFDEFDRKHLLFVFALKESCLCAACVNAAGRCLQEVTAEERKERRRAASTINVVAGRKGGGNIRLQIVLAPTESYNIQGFL